MLCLMMLLLATYIQITLVVLRVEILSFVMTPKVEGHFNKAQYTLVGDAYINDFMNRKLSKGLTLNLSSSN